MDRNGKWTTERGLKQVKRYEKGAEVLRLLQLMNPSILKLKF